MNNTELTTNDPHHTYSIQKNEQNDLKGVLWATSGLAFGVSAISSMIATPKYAFETLKLMGGTLKYDSVRRSLGGFALLMPTKDDLIVYTVAGVALTGLTALAAYMATKVTSYCVRNAIYHLGPEYQITRKPKDTRGQFNQQTVIEESFEELDTAQA